MNEKSLSMRAARWLAVVIIVGVASAAFVLSFAALRGLGEEAHVDARLAWLLPVVVDGTIVLATVGWLVMAGARTDRHYFLAMLAAGAAVSVAGNSLHAIAAGHLLPGWACALVAAIAPISLLADTHGLAVLFRAAQHYSAPMPAPVPVESASTSAPLTVAVAAARRGPVRRDPAVVARAVALRAEGHSYARIGKVLGVSARTAANYAPKPAGTPAVPEVSVVPVVAGRELRPVSPARPVGPAQPVMLPVAVPVGGGR